MTAVTKGLNLTKLFYWSLFYARDNKRGIGSLGKLWEQFNVSRHRYIIPFAKLNLRKQKVQRKYIHGATRENCFKWRLFENGNLSCLSIRKLVWVMSSYAKNFIAYQISRFDCLFEFLKMLKALWLVEINLGDWRLFIMGVFNCHVRGVTTFRC